MALLALVWSSVFAVLIRANSMDGDDCAPFSYGQILKHNACGLVRLVSVVDDSRGVLDAQLWYLFVGC
jgi:hypothetical protein